MKHARHEWAWTAAMIVSAIPLVIYPAILMAGVMGLAAPRPDVVTIKHRVAVSFLWMSVCYPLWFGAAWVVYGVVSKRAGAILAIGYLAACVGLFAAWYGLSK